MPEDFIVDHPGVATSLIAALATLLISFITWWFKIIRSKLVEHIKKEEEVLIPQMNARFDMLTNKLLNYHLDNIERFASIDKRLTLLETAKKDDMNEILTRLDDLAEKMDEGNG